MNGRRDLDPRLVPAYLAIFLLLGPPLGACCVYGVLRAGDPGNALPFLPFLILGYLYGAVPALLTGLMSWTFSGRPRSAQLAASAACGFLFSTLLSFFAPLVMSSLLPFGEGAGRYVGLGLLLAAQSIAPALVCTALSRALHGVLERKSPAPGSGASSA